ncbi:MAG: DUF4833 domain-containing protein [Endomicrobium sp.]|jgi:hypothetical protein|nr:DUF4833 domain-containing protein [Endomicrobium sp.]
MKKAVTTLSLWVTCLFLLNSGVSAENKPLFRIERNKNANVVMYDARLDANGNIDKKNPIDAYWILFTKQGQRKEISAFEKKAYGYNATEKKDNSYNLVLKAVKDKPMTIVLVNGEPKAEILINNKEAYLSSVYVSASDALIPKVSYLILTGTDQKTGTKVTEKIIPQ